MTKSFVPIQRAYVHPPGLRHRRGRRQRILVLGLGIVFATLIFLTRRLASEKQENVLVPLAWSRDRELPWHPKNRSSTNLALVVPYIESDIERVLEHIGNWSHIGDACSAAISGRTGLFLYNNLADISTGSRLKAKIETIMSDTQTSVRILECFTEIQIIYADLSPEEDDYPEGPSVMFFSLLLQERLRDEALAGYHYIFWMEWDVYPLQKNWIDALVRETSFGDEFWMRGSHYHGPGLDSTVKLSPDISWLGHLNGNALYNLRDPCFHKFLRLVMEREPPTDYWRPFDVSIWKVLNDFPYSWRLYQEYRHKFQHSEIIRHVSFNGYEDLLVNFPNLYLLHGHNSSAGNGRYFRKFKNGLPTTNRTLLGNKIRPDLQLSVMMRTFSGDMDFASLAFESAKRYIPHAYEFIAVVLEEEVELARQHLPQFVVVHGEPRLMDSQHIQQKYSKLNADRYCKGRFILHLDSDVVLTRALLYKDVFVFGKPILEFDLYTNLIQHMNIWQNGTAYALGRPVAYDYSRSNEHIYPRHIYKCARTFLEKRFDTSFVDFLQTRKGTMNDLKASFNQTSSAADIDMTALFSDFNFIGAFLHSEMPDEVSWHFIGREGKSPFEEDVFRQVIRPPFTCQGNARTVTQALDPGKAHLQQLKLLADIAHGKKTCAALKSVLW